MIFYLDPRSFAALACTCKAWRALGVGADSLWRDKLSVLQALWPNAGLPSDEGILTYYRVGGTDPTAWARRYAKAQAVAPKLSATACDVAGAEGFRTRIFGDGRTEERGACAARAPARRRMLVGRSALRTRPTRPPPHARRRRRARRRAQAWLPGTCFPARAAAAPSLRWRCAVR